MQLIGFIDSTYHQIQTVVKTTIWQKQDNLLPTATFNKHLKEKITILKNHQTTLTSLKSQMPLDKLSLKKQTKVKDFEAQLTTAISCLEKMNTSPVK